MNEYNQFKKLEQEEVMCLNGGASEYECVDPGPLAQWFSNLFEIFK